MFEAIKTWRVFPTPSSFTLRIQFDKILSQLLRSMSTGWYFLNDSITEHKGNRNDDWLLQEWTASLIIANLSGSRWNFPRWFPFKTLQKSIAALDWDIFFHLNVLVEYGFAGGVSQCGSKKYTHCRVWESSHFLNKYFNIKCQFSRLTTHLFTSGSLWIIWAINFSRLEVRNCLMCQFCVFHFCHCRWLYLLSSWCRKMFSNLMQKKIEFLVSVYYMFCVF